MTVFAAIQLSLPSCSQRLEDPHSKARELLDVLKDKRWDSLAEMVHPTKGVLFSPYGHVDTQVAVVLLPEQVEALDKDPKVRRWGYFDGTGLPIEMSFSDYYDRFLYDHDYSEKSCGSPNEQLGHGNTLNNIPQVFSERSVFIECHFGGSERYSGMDWRSVRIVLEPVSSRWFVVGLVHDEWTI